MVPSLLCGLIRHFKDVRLARVVLPLHPSDDPVAGRNNVAAFKCVNPAVCFHQSPRNRVLACRNSRMVTNLEPLHSLNHHRFFSKFHSNLRKFIYTGRIDLAVLGTPLHTPKTISFFITLFTFPLPLSPVNLMMSSIDGPYPNRFQYSSMHKNTIFCFGVISLPSAPSKSLTRSIALHPTYPPATPTQASASPYTPPQC